MPMILQTDNGTHSPEKWALVTAKTIFDLSATSLKGEDILKAEKLRLMIADALMPHHSNTQTKEKHRLTTNAKNILEDFDVSEHIDEAMSDILSAAKGTPWEEHFNNEDVQKAVINVLGSHFTTAQHIERLWHSDKNPKCKFAAAYKAKIGV